MDPRTAVCGVVIADPETVADPVDDIPGKALVGVTGKGPGPVLPPKRGGVAGPGPSPATKAGRCGRPVEVGEDARGWAVVVGTTGVPRCMGRHLNKPERQS